MNSTPNKIEFVVEGSYSAAAGKPSDIVIDNSLLSSIGEKAKLTITHIMQPIIDSGTYLDSFEVELCFGLKAQSGDILKVILGSGEASTAIKIKATWKK